MTLRSDVNSLSEFYRQHEDQTTVSYRAFTDRAKKLDKYPTLEDALELNTAGKVSTSTQSLSFDMDDEDDDEEGVFQDIQEDDEELKTEAGRSVKKPRGA